MAHNRKVFYSYPPDFKPGDGRKSFTSKRAAKKATRQGGEVWVAVRSFDKPRTDWTSSILQTVWVHHDKART